MKKINPTIGNTILFFPEAKEFIFLREELHQALDVVGLSGQVVLGPKVFEFETNLAQKVSRKFVVSCASGTDAITLSLKALDIKRGDEVIVPANSYPSVFGVALSGATPVLVDVDYDTGGIDPSLISKSITKRTKAILAVHLYGFPADLKEILKISKKAGVSLLEDCAQALGSTYDGKPLGSFGDMAIFSFYPTKNIGALGDGGAVVTNNRNLYTKLQALRIYGEVERYNSQMLGMNSRLDELQAAFMLKKIKHLSKWVNRRILLAGIYRKAFKDIKSIELLPEISERKNSYHLFPIRTEKRNDLQKWLTENNIQTGIHYPRSIHQTKTFSLLSKGRSFPNAEKWNKATLSLPLHPFLTEGEVTYVAQKVTEFFKK